MRFRPILAFIIVLLSAALAGSPCEAQLGFLPKFRIRAGIFNPSSPDLKSVSGDTWLKIGADVSLPVGIPLVGGGTRVGIDYMESKNSRIVPITLTQIIQPSAIVAHSPIYLGAGIGLFNGKISGRGSGTSLGARMLAGLDINGKLFVEAQYDVVGKVAGTRIDGFSFMVGTKF